MAGTFESEGDMTNKEKIERLEVALNEYQRFNGIHNDLESYLFDLGNWALDETFTKPDAKQFGVEP